MISTWSGREEGKSGSPLRADESQLVASKYGA
jgi:hypothetical protein